MVIQLQAESAHLHSRSRRPHSRSHNSLGTSSRVMLDSLRGAEDMTRVAAADIGSDLQILACGAEVRSCAEL